MAEINNNDKQSLGGDRQKQSLLKRVVTVTGAATILALGGAGYKLTDPGKDGREARIFTTPYSDIVSSFLRENPSWVIPKNGVSNSNIGKGRNLPYEGPPLALFSDTGILIDLAYPQSRNISDRISLSEFLEKNNIPPQYLPRLHDILLSEHILMSHDIRTLRENLPDTFLMNGGDRSHSAMKVKPRFIQDFGPEDQKKIVDRAMNYLIKPADRSRSITLGREPIQTDGTYQPLYKILGYDNSGSATDEFMRGKIDTKSEVGFAFGMSILQYIQDTIDGRVKNIGVMTNDTGNTTIEFPSGFYTESIYPIINTTAGYGAISRRDITPEEQSLTGQIISIRAQIQSLQASKGNTGKIRLLNKKLADLGVRKAMLDKKRMEEIRQSVSRIASAHLTLTRSDLNTVGKLLTEINRAAAYYPTNIDRAFGKKGVGTYDQFMLNLIAWNNSFGTPKVPEYLSIDGDPGMKTQELMKQYGFSDETIRKSGYDAARDQSLRHVVSWKGTIDDTIVGKNTTFGKDLSSLIGLSFEHRYVFIRILTSYLTSLEKVQGVDRELRTTIESAWIRYITHMDEKSFRDILQLVSNPGDLIRAFGLTDHPNRNQYIRSFYTSWLIPRLEATTYHLSLSGVVTPMIQNSPKKKWGFDITNTSNTIGRAIVIPGSTFSLDPSGKQDFRRTPVVNPSGRGGLFSQEHYDIPSYRVSYNTY